MSNNTKPYNLRKRKSPSTDQLQPVSKKKSRKTPPKLPNEEINWNEWVSASGVKNYLLSDPVIDWFEEYYSEYGLARATDGKNHEKNHKKNTPKKRKVTFNLPKNIQKKPEDFLSYILQKGNEFEKAIMTHLNEKYPGDVVTVADSHEVRDPEKVKRTLELMQLGTPIIYQAVLHNHETKTYGMPDLLIRSDWLNNLIIEDPVPEDEVNITAENLQKYHYRVVDIKWSTLKLRSDGKHILNADRYPAYKGQLLIYNEALGKLQGYTPPTAYILGRRWSYRSKNFTNTGNTSFERLGHIDFKHIDAGYFQKVEQAVQWKRDVKQDGMNWTLIPPSRKELYPNIANYSDMGWRGPKYKLAEELDEITLLWMCGLKNRQKAHSEGVFKWTDERCTAQLLGVMGEVNRPILESILEVNSPDCDSFILPGVITNDFSEWQRKEKLSVFVDFETISEIFEQGSETPEFSGTTRIFMIGVGWILGDNIWNYKCFVADDMSHLAERNIFQKFYEFVMTLIKTHMKRSDGQLNLYHWGSAERTQFNTVNNRNNRRWTNELFNWVDFLNVFKDEPIVVKGALKFGLKEIGKAMFKNNLIETTWDENSHCTDGNGAMVHAWKCYKIAEEKNINVKEIGLMKEIIKYNETDCKVLYEIISYLKHNCCREKKIKMRKLQKN